MARNNDPKSSYELRIHNLESANAELEKNIRALDADLGDKRHQIRELHKQKEKIEEQRDEALEKFKIAEMEKTSARSGIELLKEEKKSMIVRIEKLSSDLAESKNTIDLQSREIIRLDQLRQTEKTIEEMAEKCAHLQEKISVMTVCYDVLKENIAIKKSIRERD